MGSPSGAAGVLGTFKVNTQTGGAVTVPEVRCEAAKSTLGEARQNRLRVSP
ncbi:hypothetical protein GCM10011503_13300 [Henriciella pelagia]|uniref:Uncharacterized protein n=1 Tax=Henriciella pelagia TaxID=1977912 RepID=A0ABQ1JGH9_9PROT|nr:hypothetical protein GCM10011503_13300 [Henriciella pelagia]